MVDRVELLVHRGEEFGALENFLDVDARLGFHAVQE